MSEKLEPIELHRYTTSICKEPKKLTPTEAAYLAGLIDGEGCLFIEKHKRVAGDQYTPILKIATTSNVMIDLCNEYGGFWIYRKEKANRKAIYCWAVYSSLCKFYLPQIFPHFRIKRKQAELFLQALIECKGRGHSQNNKLMEIYKKQIQKLGTKPHLKTLP
jgi:hypothetical protein